MHTFGRPRRDPAFGVTGLRPTSIFAGRRGHVAFLLDSARQLRQKVSNGDRYGRARGGNEPVLGHSVPCPAQGSARGPASPGSAEVDENRGENACDLGQYRPAGGGRSPSEPAVPTRGDACEWHAGPPIHDPADLQSEGSGPWPRRREFGGRIGRDWRDSEPWWPPEPHRPRVRRTWCCVVLDDVGFAQLGCYGSDIATPAIDRLAAGGVTAGQLPHDGAVLAHPGLPADRPQPPPQRHGPRGRPGLGLPGLLGTAADGERLPVGDPARRTATPPTPSGSGT